MRDPKNQVGQALVHLQKTTKFRRPRIKKFFGREGKNLGWTTYEDEIFA